MQRISSFLFALLFLSATVAWAEEKPTIQVSIPVANQSLLERDQALHAAGLQLLRRTDPQFAQSSAARTQLNQVSRWVQSYTYLPRANAQDGKPWLFVVHFDPKIMPALSKPSPSHVATASQAAETHKIGPVFVFLAVSDGQGHTTVVGDSSAIAKQLKQQANASNVELLFPLLDLDESNQLQGDVVHQAVNMPSVRDGLQSLAKKYGPKIVIFGKITPSTPGSWRSEWHLIQPQDQEHWVFAGQAFDKHGAFLTQSLVNLTAPILLPPVPTQMSSLGFTVRGIRSEMDYFRVLHYLQQMPQVAAITPDLINANAVTFNVQWRGTPQSFKSQLAHNAWLVPAGNKSTAQTPLAAQASAKTTNNLTYAMVT